MKKAPSSAGGFFCALLGRYVIKRKGPAKTPFYLNRHENLLSQNVPYIL